MPGDIVAVIVETTPPGVMARAVRRPADLWPAQPNFVKGLRMLGILRHSRVAWYSGTSDLKVLGQGRAAGLSFRSAGMQHSLEAETVALREGVVPNTRLTQLVGAEHFWNPQQRCFQPGLDEWGESSAPGIYVAGDSGGIAGAAAAELSGRIMADLVTCGQASLPIAPFAFDRFAEPHS